MLNMSHVESEWMSVTGSVCCIFPKKIEYSEENEGKWSKWEGKKGFFAQHDKEERRKKKSNCE